MILALLILVLLIFRKPIKKIMTRGYRNNNPGNIRNTYDSHGNIVLLYEGETLSKDSEFKSFRSIEYGYRAIFALLSHYIHSKGLNTIRKIINTYAPTTENDTSSYVTRVSLMTSTDPDQLIDFNDSDLMKKFVGAISYVENGINANTTEISNGLNLFYA